MVHGTEKPTLMQELPVDDEGYNEQRNQALVD
jgi:hypothetical protein